MKTLRHRRKRKGDFTSYLIFVASDILALSSAFVLAYLTRFYGLNLYFREETPDLRRYAIALLTILTIFIWSFRNKQIYLFDILRRRLDEIALIIQATFMAALVVMALTFLYRDFSYSRIVFALHCLYSIILVVLFRHIAYVMDGWVRILLGSKIRIVVIGANRNARQIIRRINRSYRNRYQVVGVFSGGNLSQEKHFESAPILGNLDDVMNKIDNANPDEVILTVPDFPDQKLSQLLFHCEKELMTLLKIPDLFGIFTSGVAIHYIDNVPLISLKKSPLDKMGNRVVKRLFDIVVSSALLVVFLPVFILVTLVILIVDGPPIFYKQGRTGMDGRSFWIYKFRTMRVDAEVQTGPVWATKNDGRTTRTGKFLRRFNIDELPQLWNVLKGDMSMVGPRPERPHFVGRFREEIPRYMARHKIKSGITGWAQVNGFRGDTSITERTKYDLYYYENWSLFLDIKILFMTFFAFKNAY